MYSSEFTSRCIQLFELQKVTVPVYQQYLRYIDRYNLKVNQISDIPFIPISCFKTHMVLANNLKHQLVFKSSGTTMQQRAQHYVDEPQRYHNNAQKLFEEYFGALHQFSIMALLPNYEAQGDSSLVNMVQYFTKCTQKENSGFYSNVPEQLYTALLHNIKYNIPTILFGVSFSLLDFIEQYKLPQNSVLKIIETGGMKGRREEITRKELHALLCEGFGVEDICSEYGMTELLSQAYSTKDGIYKMNGCLRVLVRDINDPFAINIVGKGALNVIDLANTHSCAFIATDDYGRVFNDNTFEVLGRLDNSDIRGCSLLSVQ